MQELFDRFSGVTVTRLDEEDTVILEVDCRLLEPHQAATVEATLSHNPCLISVRRIERSGDDDPYSFCITKKPKDECYWRMLYSILRDAVARISTEITAIQLRPMVSMA